MEDKDTTASLGVPAISFLHRSDGPIYKRMTGHKSGILRHTTTAILVCLTLPVPEPPVCNNNWGLFTIWGLRNQFGCCTLKPNTFPMRTTGVSNVIQFTHVHLGCNVLEWYIHTWKKMKKKTSKKRQKRKHKNIYMYSAGYDVNGTIAEKERTFWEKL